jgi:hypothetical protein
VHFMLYKPVSLGVGGHPRLMAAAVAHVACMQARSFAVLLVLVPVVKLAAGTVPEAQHVCPNSLDASGPDSGQCGAASIGTDMQQFPSGAAATRVTGKQ